MAVSSRPSSIGRPPFGVGDDNSWELSTIIIIHKHNEMCVENVLTVQHLCSIVKHGKMSVECQISYRESRRVP